MPYSAAPSGWVIIAGQVSPLRLRLLATALPLAVALWAAMPAPVFGASPDTWHLLTQQPQGAGRQPVLAITVDPNTPTRVIYGTATGEVLLKAKDHVLLSNTLTYAGHLSIPIDNLESIPEEERVGKPLSADAGTIVVRFKNRADVRSL